MDIEFHTTVYVFGEIKDPEQKKLITGLIVNGLLIIDIFKGDDFVQFTETMENAIGNNLSEADWSVLLLAKRLDCRLLTADQKLIYQCKLHGVEANGFLWLTDKMVEAEVVERTAMAEFLQKYKDTNSRAPEPETSERIKEYKGEIQQINV